MNSNFDNRNNGRQNRNNNNSSRNGNTNNNADISGNNSSGNTVNSGLRTDTVTENSKDINWLQTQIQSHPEFRTPPQQSFDDEEMIGSIQKILAENIGIYVVIEFLIGTNRIHRKQGYIYHVGTSYITLYDDENDNFILCDIFSVKFVYFYMPGQRPNRNFNLLPTNNGNMG